MSEPIKTRVISPAIAALREEHKKRVAELKAKEQSAATLKRIEDDLLPKLSKGDLEELIAKADAEFGKKEAE